MDEASTPHANRKQLGGHFRGCNEAPSCAERMFDIREGCNFADGNSPQVALKCAVAVEEKRKVERPL